MADPKYANLPGIAHDQPDVFETNELPESEQHLEGNIEEETSNAVETLHLSANEAFGKFKGKHLDAKNVDFSDRLKPTKHRLGYVSWSGEWELNPGQDENPLQKYQRLNCEVRELLEEIDALKKDESKGDGQKSESQSFTKVAGQVSALKDELSKLKLEEVLGSEAIGNLQDPQKATNAKLMSHLEQIKKMGHSKSSKQSSQPSASSDMVTYELLMKPESTKMEENEKLAKFDKRVEALEKALGAKPDALNSLSLETSQKSVADSINVLSARTALLDPSHLDHIEGRLSALQSKMNLVAEKKQVIEEQEKVNKIGALYDMVQKTQSMAEVLPAVVDRLDALQELHEQALLFSKSLTQLESCQDKISSKLKGNQDCLKQAQEKFMKDIEAIQGNFKLLEERTNKLTK